MITLTIIIMDVAGGATAIAATATEVTAAVVTAAVGMGVTIARSRPRRFAYSATRVASTGSSAKSSARREIRP
jgi:hypothetical protein